MKNLFTIAITLIFMLSFFGCSKETKKPTLLKTEEIVLKENFDWLLGNWKRNNEKVGKETFEIWNKISDTVYYGIGFTMEGKDTVKQEKMHLLQINKKWELQVQPQDGPEPITFKMISYKSKEFTCENKQLDFPKHIKYWKKGDKLAALVSNDEVKIAFEFDKIIK